MRCPNPECGAAIDDDARVCPHCGTELKPILPPRTSKVVHLGSEATTQASRNERARTLAIASVLLALLSCPLLWGYAWHLVWTLVSGVALVSFIVLAALAAIVTGHIAIAMDRRARGVSWRLLSGTLLGYFNIAALVILLAIVFFSKGRPTRDMNVCAGNLQRLQTVLREYADKNQGMYPPLSSQPGVLMFSAKSIPANDESGPLPLTCPTIRYAKPRAAGQKASSKPANALDDRSYFYLGYAVLNDDAVEAFAKAYRKRITEGGSFDDDLVVEDGEGRHVLHRLAFGVDELLHATQDRFSISPNAGRELGQDVPFAIIDDVPLLIERDLGHVYTNWDGRPRGAWVLYLSRGVQFVKSGTWPITEKTQRILAELADE